MKQSFVVVVVAVVIVVVAVFVIVVEAESSNFKGLEKEKEFRVFLIWGIRVFEKEKETEFPRLYFFFSFFFLWGFSLCVGILFSMQNGSLG